MHRSFVIDLVILPIDKSKRMRYTGRAPTTLAREILIITRRQQFVKRKVAQILMIYFSHFCAFCLLHSIRRCGIMIMSRGSSPRNPRGAHLAKVEEVSHLFRSKSRIHSVYEAGGLFEQDGVSHPWCKSSRQDAVEKSHFRSKSGKKFAKPLDKSFPMCYT